MGWEVALLKPCFSSNKNNFDTKTSVRRMLWLLPLQEALFFCVWQSSLHSCPQSRQAGRWFQFLSVLFLKVKGGNAWWRAALISNEECRKVYYLQIEQHLPRTKVNLVLDLSIRLGQFPLLRSGRKTSVTQLSPFSLIIFLDESSSLLLTGFQATSSTI